MSKKLDNKSKIIYTLNMEIKVTTKSSAKRDLLLAVANLYARILKIEKSKFVVIIDTVPGFAKARGMNGAACLIKDKVIAVALDSKLSLEQTFITLAHEMVHVKQRAKGQLKNRIDGKGRVVWTWMGRDYNTDYFESPWEIEAFSRERIMANKVAHIIVNG